MPTIAQGKRSRRILAVLIGLASGVFLLAILETTADRLDLATVDQEYGVWHGEDFWQALVRARPELKEHKRLYQFGSLGLCQLRLGITDGTCPNRLPQVAAFAAYEDLEAFLKSQHGEKPAIVFALVATEVNLRFEPLSPETPKQIKPPRLIDCGNFWFFTQVGERQGHPVWETFLNNYFYDTDLWHVYHTKSLPQLVQATRAHSSVGQSLMPAKIVWFALSAAEQSGATPGAKETRIPDTFARQPAPALTSHLAASTRACTQISRAPTFASLLGLSRIRLLQRNDDFLPSYADLSSNLVRMTVELFANKSYEIEPIAEFEVPKKWWVEFEFYLSPRTDPPVEPLSGPLADVTRLGKISLEMKDGRKYEIVFYTHGHNPPLFEVNRKHWVHGQYNVFHRARDGGLDIAELIRYIHAHRENK
jgi:hypothetical protein